MSNKEKDLLLIDDYAILNNLTGDCHQLDEFYELAVIKNGLSLQYIPMSMRTKKICISAVSQNGLAIQFVPVQHIYLCRLAIKNCPHALTFVKNQTATIVIGAILVCPFALKFVINQTPQIIKLAVDANPHALVCIDEESTNKYTQKQLTELEKIYESVVSKNGLMLEHIKNPSPFVCIIAVSQNGYAIKYITNKIPDLYKLQCSKLAVNQNGMVLKYIDKNITTSDLFDVILIAVNQNPKSLKFIKNFINYNLLTEENLDTIYKSALSKNGLSLRYIDHTITKNILKMYRLAVNQNGLAIQFVYISRIVSSRKFLDTYLSDKSISINKPIHDKVEQNLLDDVDRNPFDLPYAESYNGWVYSQRDIFGSQCSIDRIKITHQLLANYYHIVHVAVQQNGYALKYISAIFQKDNICKAAVIQNPYTLGCIKKQSPDRDIEEICKIAIQKNPWLLRDIRYITPALYEFAVSMDGLILEIIGKKNQTPEICRLAIGQNPEARQFVKIELNNIATTQVSTTRVPTIPTDKIELNNTATTLVPTIPTDKIRSNKLKKQQYQHQIVQPTIPTPTIPTPTIPTPTISTPIFTPIPGLNASIDQANGSISTGKFSHTDGNTYIHGPGGCMINERNGLVFGQGRYAGDR